MDKATRPVKPVFTDYPLLGEVPEFEFTPTEPDDVIGGRRVVGMFQDPRALALAQRYITTGLTKKEADIFWKYLDEVFFQQLAVAPKH